jgi:hypothetical protein
MAATTYAKGFSLSIDGVTIGKIMMDGVPNPEPEAEKVDDTTQDSGDYYEYVLGMIESGEADLQCIYDPDDEGQAALLAAYAALDIHSFILTYPNNLGRKSFNAYVMRASIVTVDKKVGLKCKLALSGGTTFSTTETKLTTPFFAITGNPGGAISNIVPAAADTPGTYIVYCANSVESVTVTPTCATSGATITVDGTPVATGVASASKALTAGAVRTILIKVSKAGETPGLYRLLVGRAAA